MKKTLSPKFIAQDEDNFLFKIKRMLDAKLNLKNDTNSKSFFLKYKYENDKALFAHLDVDLFNNEKEFNNKKEKIIKFIEEIKEKYKDLFKEIESKCDLNILNDNNNTKTLNKFLANLYQFPADFSQGWLGSFYPFCKFTNKCYKYDKNCKVKRNIFSIDQLKICGFWIVPDNKESSKEKLKQIKSIKEKEEELKKKPDKEKLEYFKYLILSEIENILFDFNIDWIFVLLPIIKRDQLIGLFFINTKKNNYFNKLCTKIDDILKKDILPLINDYYDNKFYHAFFTEIEREFNYSKILANPYILSNIFAIKSISPNNKLDDDIDKYPISFQYVREKSNYTLKLSNSEIKIDTICFEEMFNEKDYNQFAQMLVDSIASVDIVKGVLNKKNLKTAIISILIDSYAHNISAHSLAALKWWFDLRQAEYDKRINLGKNSDPPVIEKLVYLLPQSFTHDELNIFATTSDNYYKILDLADSSNDKNYTSLLEVVRFADEDLLYKLFCYAGYKNAHDIEKYFRFPIPVDFALSNFIKFLRDKAAFWSGVTRDLQIGGEIKNLYEILWNDFATNPLYLGTIAYSEGIKKLNISIELSDGNGGYKKYEFAKIDMSVIEYEAELYNSEKGITQADLTEINYSSLDIVQNPIKYSKYALFYPGKDHYELKKELEEHYNIFLPGGVVGEHALFTLFENTLRNIKHYSVTDDMKNKGLNFTLRIEPSMLMKDDLPQIGSKEHKLFKFFVYLDHKNRLFDFILDNKKAQLIRVKENLEKQTSKSVVDESGVPKLGGNSQDKICAAMLRNNQFISVEPSYIKDKETEERNKFYYNSDKNLYWIGFEDSLSEEDVKSVSVEYENLRTKIIQELNEKAKVVVQNPNDVEKINTLKQEYGINFDSENQVKIDESFEKYFYKNSKEAVLNIINKYQGIFYKYFHLWKGDFIYAINNKDQLKNENISRFKFIYNDEKLLKDDDFKVYLTKKGVIRILTSDDFNNIKNVYKQYHQVLKDYVNDTFNSSDKDTDDLIKKIQNSEKLNFIEEFFIYLAWLYKFIDNEKICFYKCAEKIDTPNMIIENYTTPDTKNKNGCKKSIYFRHGSNAHGIEEKEILDYRSHGWMRVNIFDNDEFRFHKNKIDSKDILVKDHYLFEEFVEVLSTKICVIDNRLNKRIEVDKKEKYENLLNLETYSELDVKNSQDDKKIWSEIKNKIKNGNYNFLVIHLSFIESLGYGEKNITDFFDIELNFKKSKPEKFYTIITSGRGRSDWMEKLDNIYKQIVMFKPIESFLSAIENAVIFKDDIQLKYNLCKIIYGS
ncbi:MAG: hypothetical protein JXA99_05185 [Candidatus Lokiarchaeota archaeon]|nr:hypothetical protein [Candidatus Lokiarchaeota archaeon]